MQKEEKNLEKQIKALKDTRDKRIKDIEIKKKNIRREIESIKNQNETLNIEGTKLNESVQQREKIYNMMNGKKEPDDKEGELAEEGSGGLKDPTKKEPKKQDDKKNEQAYKKAMYVSS